MLWERRMDVVTMDVNIRDVLWILAVLGDVATMGVLMMDVSSISINLIMDVMQTPTWGVVFRTLLLDANKTSGSHKVSGDLESL